MMEVCKKFRIFVYMIPVSLPSGKVTFITLEESLEDDFMEKLIAKDEGYENDNPFDNQINRIMSSEEWNNENIPILSKNEIEIIEKDIKKYEDS